MSDMLIRGVEPDLSSDIKRLAKEQGRSVSAVAKGLLRKGLADAARGAARPELGLADEIRRILGPDGFADLEIERDMSERPPPDFS
jgi:hypothetical protein